MLPCPACLPATSLLPAQPLALPRLGELDFHTHTHPLNVCVRCADLPSVCLPSACLPTSCLPCPSPPALSRSAIHRTDGNLLIFCVEIHMQKPNQFRPSFAGAASCRSAQSLLPFPLSPSQSLRPFSVCLFCVLFFSPAFPFPFHIFTLN